MGYLFSLVLFLPISYQSLGTNIFQTVEGTLKNKTILLIIAHENFRDEEYEVPRGIFEKLGAKVIVASSDTTIAKGMIELTVKPDTLISQVDPVDFDAIIFVGGSGAKEYFDNETVHRIAKLAYEKGKVLGAICIAPVILAKAGILKDKKATVWKDGETLKNFKKYGVEYTGLPVVMSGKIVTANGPRAAKPFAEEIVNILLKKDEPRQLKRSTDK